MTKGMENAMADTKLFNIKGTVKEYCAICICDDNR